MAKKDKNKLFDDQFDNEEVLYVFRKHPIVMRKGFIFASIAVLLPMFYILILTFVYANNPEKMPTVTAFFVALFAGFVLSALVFSPSWISWYYSIFIITDQRLIQLTQKGLFHKTVVDLSLSQIQSLNYEVGGLQATLLGFGTIMVQTYMGDLVIHDVHHPGHVVKKLTLILRDHGVEPTSMVAAQKGSDKSDKEEEENDEDA